MNNPRDICIAFDLDDTLYKERDFVLSGYRAVAEAMATEKRPAEQLYGIMTSSANAFDALSYALNDRYSVDDFLKIYRCHVPDIKLSTDTENTLTYLKGKGYKLGLITDGRSLTQRNKIRSLGLERFIPAENMIVSEEINADKTTPNPFEMLKLKLEASQYSYVGDNVLKDFHWPNLLGWETVMLRDPESVNVHRHPLDGVDEEYRPQYIIDNITELCQLH